MEKSLRSGAVHLNPDIPDLVGRVHRAAEELLNDPENESLRAPAADLAARLVTTCRATGVRRATRAAQAIGSLVSMASEDMSAIRVHLREKLLELVTLVKDSTKINVGKSG